MFKEPATINYPFEKGPLSPRFRVSTLFVAILPGGALHRLQALRGHLPSTGHHYRGRGAIGWCSKDDAL
ncbi:NADH iron-sulfur protein 5 mitochondrial-like protein [Caligus rogercresseyi]|uniref:NADH iron-sulfur protein 5 mitochondrial-like protein n=1 Tax=Caligus rogercresseyi TaxID=217165 RepID=A0A7T8QVG3_CALRO|nr:NADH iron-sulfur protein 5 mitochondrial-like protein [Caligus rogercresseyi]